MSPTHDSEPTVVMGASAPPRMTQQPDRRGVSSSLAYVGVGLLALIAGGAIVAFLMSRGSTPSNTPLQQTNVIPVNASSVSTNTANNQVPSSSRSPEVVKYPDSSLQPLTADSVKNLMSVWERAQESKSFASYQACYDSSFVGIKKTKSGHSQSYSYSSWMADRRRMIGSAVNLNIDLSNLQVRVDGDTAIVQFDQYYRSLRYSDWGPKEITVRMTPAGPKIVREELKASYPL